MDPYERCCVRLPLDGACNVRELGGYPTTNDGHTRFRRFLRSDGLSLLTPRDEKLLHDYGVRAVIDLREPHEASADPDRTIGTDVAFVNVPLFDYNVADAKRGTAELDFSNMSLGALYCEILGNYEAVRSCFRFIASVGDGCVLFHCAAGKDRTGILSMLLLSLAGVDKWDIVADYVQSRPNLMRSGYYAEQWEDASLQAWRSMLDSPAEAIESAYDYIIDVHGGVENYLLACGVPDEDVAAVRRRLVDE